MDTIEISRDDLKAALLQWEQDHRNGKCADYAETLNQHIDEVVERSTEYVWASLTAAMPA